MNKIHYFLRYHNKHIKCKKNIAIITQIWHRAQCYFTYISNTWYLITVPNMNKINPFFSEISQQIHKMYEKLATITQNWQRAKCYFTFMSNTLFLIIVPDMKKTPHSLRYHNKHAKFMNKWP